jgi:hypothetical protein
MASKDELEKLRNEFEGSAAQRAGLTFNDFMKLVQATPKKAPVTVSRGSNKAKQVGDQNQREAYNSNKSNSKVSKAELSKRSKAVKNAKAAGVDALGTEMGLADAMKKRKQQRAGGKGK